MAFVVETGQLPDGANAYCGVDFADAYLAARGHADWPAPGESQAEKEAALVKAADYLNGLSWRGRKVKADEPRVMAWPRTGATDSDGWEIGEDVIPYAVKAASAFLARLALGGQDLQPVLERGGRIQREKVGSLETEFFDDAPARDVYCGLADLLKGLAADFDDYGGSGGTRTTFHQVSLA